MITAKKSAIAASLAALTFTLGGCSVIDYWWQYYDGEVDTSLREPTGYYEHTEAVAHEDPLVVPEGLEEPQTDKALALPPYPQTYVQGSLGEDVDVRPPLVPIRSSQGIQAQWVDGEAIVWLQGYGYNEITTEEEAWSLLHRLLGRLHIDVGEVTQGAYELTTMAADYNEFGTPYSHVNSDNDNLRYRQIYRIRIGRDANNNIGIAVSLVGSMTLLNYGFSLDDILTPTELQRFAMGFANEIIKEVDEVSTIAETIPQVVTVTLDRDNNDQDAMIVNAPYNSTFDAIRSMLPEFGFEINEYSVSHSSVNVTYEEQDPEFFHDKGVEDFGLEDGDYIIRVAVDGSNSVITFYDDDDKPLKSEIVSRLYPGFSEALIKEFALY